MATGFLTPDARLRVFSDAGLVLPGSLLHTYVAGTPSTPLTTYNNADLAVGHENANPVVASLGGLFGPIYLTPGSSYKLVLTDASGNPIWSQDNVLIPASLSAPVTVIQGGTGLIVGVSGGVLYFSGTTAIASSGLLVAHGVVLGGGAGAAPLTTAVGATGQVLTGVTGADPIFATPQLTVLKAGTGTDASAGATTVDSIAISGLTALDTLRVVVNLETVTQNTAQVQLYSVTDAVQLLKVSTSPLATANPVVLGEALLKQRNGLATSYGAVFQGMNTASVRVDDFQNNTGLTAWTGTWTLGLRHGGVTAGGTFKWTWAVYKVAGQ